MFCVSLHWLFDSIEKGFCQDESRYAVERNASKSTRPLASTPTGSGKKEGEYLIRDKGQALSHFTSCD